MKTLITGGLGFIGSHTVVALQERGHDVIIVDDLSNSSIKVLKGIEKITNQQPVFEQMNLRKKDNAQTLFQKHPDINGIIHFAASKAVGKSVEDPLLYYENNLASLICLLQECVKKPSIDFIFSSSCTVYGQADQLPITEEAPIKRAESPYGNTKQIGEEIIKDVCKVHSNIKATVLRYFNPIGAHPTAHIGELPLGVPQNLVPFITQAAAGLRPQLSIYGNDYPTSDGTCIRDYIHVMDLAEAHVIALERLKSETNQDAYEIFNLGTGKGSSVLEVIKAFEEATDQKLNYTIVSRRPGDVTAAYADTTKAVKALKWKPKYTLKDALLHAWQWQKTASPF